MNEQINILKLRKEVTEDPSPEHKGPGVWEFLNKDILFKGGAITDKIKADFYLEMASMLEAGIDIRIALELVKEGFKKAAIKSRFESILQKIMAGRTLSAAMKMEGGFSNYELFSLKIGEETGKIVQILKDLAKYFDQKLKQKRQIIGALTYPLIVLVVAFSAVAFMISFVVPMFSDTFKRFGSDLPGITVAVIKFASLVKKYLLLFIILICTSLIFLFMNRKKITFRKHASFILLKFPILGGLISKIYLTRFAHTMSLLIGAKIPIINAIKLTSQMVTFYPIENSLEIVEKKIISGVSLHKSLSEHSIYPLKMVSIIKVAEEVNQLELFFGRLADQYSNDVEYQTSLIGKFIEPLIIVVLGLVVGVILIAMYLPLFKLGQTF